MNHPISVRFSRRIRRFDWNCEGEVSYKRIYWIEILSLPFQGNLLQEVWFYFQIRFRLRIRSVKYPNSIRIFQQVQKSTLHGRCTTDTHLRTILTSTLVIFKLYLGINTTLSVSMWWHSEISVLKLSRKSLPLLQSYHQTWWEDCV